MPLLRNLKMRLFDNYVGHNLTSIVRNDYQSQFDISGVSFPATQVSVSVPNGYVFDLEDEDCIVGLDEVSDDGIYELAGNVYDFSSSQQAMSVFFDQSWLSEGYYKDEDNDSLLMPSDGGDFTISFWLNPWQYPSGIYDVISKKITSTGNHRFRVYLDSTGTDSVMRFATASVDGYTEESVSAEIIPSRWSLVIARCKRRKLSLNVLCADGFVAKESQTTSVDMGCQDIGDPLYLGIGSDGVSNPLHAGSFYLQQVCFWDKCISDSEETELFSRGRGKVRFSDPAVPETFTGTGKYGSVEFQDSGWQVDLDSDGKVTRVYDNSFVSPYIPCKTCDSEPFCYPVAIADPSPDQITISVDWSVVTGTCIPSETEFVMTRLPRQIIQGFIFGRTFESEKITLDCGGYIQFFLESTPRHWSQYRYRQYLGIETNYGGTKRLVKFNVTMGSALVRNSVTGGSNKFTSPSIGSTPVSFDFPFTDSFSDYASDIVSAGWSDYATVTLDESFASDGCPQNEIDAACVVADGYIFGFGEDYPEVRQGYYGWQMGIAETISGSDTVATQDSMYNYKVTCGSPSSSHNTRVDPGIALLNRPFSALARGEIGCHDEDGNIIDSDLPFSGFTAVLSPTEFVRPLPFSTSLSGGCIDCTVSSEFDSDVTPSVGTFLTSQPTRTISTSQCPQKTLSGTTSAILSGAIGLNPSGSGLLAALGAPGQQATLIAARARFRDSQNGNDWLNHLGGTLRANGDIQFTSQISDYDGNSDNDPYLLVDTKSDDKIDPNQAGTHVSKIKKGTRVLPWIKDDTTLVNETPETASDVRRTQPDKGSSSGSATRFTPVAGTQEISVLNCPACLDQSLCENLEIEVSVSGVLMDSIIDSPESEFSWDITGGCGQTGTQILTEFSGEAVSATLYPGHSTFAGYDGMFGICRTVGVGGNLILERDPFGLYGPLSDIPCVTPGSCELSHIDLSLNYGPFISEGLDAEIQSIEVLQSDAGLLLAKIYYSVSQTEVLVMSQDNTIYWNHLSPGAAVTSSRTTSATGSFSFTKTEFRVAEFRSNAEENECLEVSRINDSPASLSFFSDELISSDPDEPTPLSELEHDAAISNGYPVDAAWPPVVAFNPSPTLGSDHLSASPGGVHVADTFATDGSTAYAAACSSAGYEGLIGTPHGYADRVTVYSPTAMLDPYVISVPQGIDWTGAVISMSVIQDEFDETSSDEVGYSHEYRTKINTDAFGSDFIVLEKQDRFLKWVYSTADSSYIVFLDPRNGKLEVFSFAGAPLRIVARYRISGFPYSRFSIAGDTQMQLVSADWSLENWPIYVTVSPV